MVGRLAMSEWRKLGNAQAFRTLSENTMKSTFKLAATLAMGLLFGLPANADILRTPPTAGNPLMDGTAESGEWNAAGLVEDQSGLKGTVYGMWSNGLTLTNGISTYAYSGKFTYILHNIEENTSFYNYPSGIQSDAYNEFLLGPGSYALDIVVSYGLDSYGQRDWGFSVENKTLGLTRTFTYDGTNAPNQTDYNWDYYWGVYASGDFNNSAFTSGLTGSIDNSNQVFEVVVRQDKLDDAMSSIIADPIPGNNYENGKYNDPIIVFVPEPGSFLLLSIGMAALKLRRRAATRFVAINGTRPEWH
jgi:hypothetical protein